MEKTSSSLVIKVKYGDMLRRFNSHIIDGELNLSADALRKKIISLFNLDASAEMILTYIDEDGDVVTLVDDNDVHDAVKQALNPLRITVKLCAAGNNSQGTRSTGSSTPLRSPRVEPSVQNSNSGVSGLLRNLPEPVRVLLVAIASKLASLASTASSSAPDGIDLVDYYINLGLSYLDPHMETQPGAQSSTQSGVNMNVTPLMQNTNTRLSGLLRNVPEPFRELVVKTTSSMASLASLAAGASSSTPGDTELTDYFTRLSLFYTDQSLEILPVPELLARGQSGPGSAAAAENDSETPSNLRFEPASKSNENLDKLKPGPAEKNNEVNSPSVTGGTMENSFVDFSAEAAPLDSRNMNAMQSGDRTVLNPALSPVHPKSDFSSTVGDKVKAKNIVESCSNGNFHMPVPPTHIWSSVGKTDGSCIASSDLPSTADNIATREKLSNLNEPNLVSGQANIGVSDPKSGGYGNMWTHSPLNECPFSGIAAGNVSEAPPQPPSVPVPFNRSMSQNDGSRNVFHRGVRCDGCGIHPIVGPRFKSKVKVDYDLCSTCFDEMGNDGDYIRMDFPMAYQSHVSFKGFPRALAKTRRSNLAQAYYRGCKVKSVLAKLDSRFIQDVNVFDGTVMPPLTPFTKIWRIRNNGALGWPKGTRLVWIGGDKLSTALSVELEIPGDAVFTNQELDIAVDFISPEQPGRYISYWRMATPSGNKFGQRIWVLIQVDASIKEVPFENTRNLNLNLPPVSLSTGPEIINVNPEPVGEYNHHEPDYPKKDRELVQPNTEQELKFPINDSLLVGNGASSSASTSVSYPIIDLSDMTPALPSVPPLLYPLPLPTLPTAPIVSPLPSNIDLEKNQVEEKLLKELEEMGFKQLDLNKEVLRMNEYNLEHAVDDLCGVTEWDPMLEELEEMGFLDREMNKKLLQKNNGSIKRVVMDLIAGEMN